MDSGGAGLRSLNQAFDELFSLKNAFQGISMAGKTDTLIIKEGLMKHDIPPDGNLSAVADAYIMHLQKEIDNDGKHIKPGVCETLEKLSIVKNVELGLLTGNLESGARIKLEAFSLNAYFPTGAFGSDDEDRNNLLPIAAKRFEELLGEKIEFDDCVVVGDTPRDVECAHIYGALCIGVATGPYSFESLVEAGADLVVQDLSDQDTLLNFF